MRGHLYFGEPLLAVLDQLGCQLVAGRDAVDELDDGLDLLAPLVVGDADDGDVADRRWARQHALHLRRVDVHPAQMIMSLARSLMKR